MRNLHGRVVLISGAGSGLGRAIARRLSTGGAHAVVGDVNVDGGRATVELIKSSGGSAESVELDVTDSAAPAEWWTASRRPMAITSTVSSTTPEPIAAPESSS